jgi:radical SAM protein with 4Fe4S-binding SPASM domain
MRILSTEYGPLIEELCQLAASVRQPVNGTFELTYRCNLSCCMCHVRQPAGNLKILQKELSPSEWIEITSQAVESGMIFLLLTGGEIFLRSDFFKIYLPLTRMGLIITLFTNGTLITENIAQNLAQAPPNSTEITIYGATTATYEAVTGIPGSYKRCCSGIEALLRNRIPCVLKTTVSRQNVHELDAMHRMADNWGVPFYYGSLVSKRNDIKSQKIEDCRLSPKDCIALETTNSKSDYKSRTGTPHESSFRNVSIFKCLVGRASFMVNPVGEMNACLDLQLIKAQPLQIGFRAAWEEVQRFIDVAPPLSITCLACSVRKFCPWCPAWSYMETGTLSAPVPYLCEIAHERKKFYEM